MAPHENPARLDSLDLLVGRWAMSASLAAADAAPPVAETTFEWLTGEQFLIQRWHVDHPDAPDGIAIIGYDADAGCYQQHYFDSRGVARVYQMSLAGGVWTLLRIAPGFSQRFTGRIDESGDTIVGRWERSADATSWEHDFELTYQRASR